MEEKTEKTWRDLPKLPLFIPTSISGNNIELVRIPEEYESNYYVLAESLNQANIEYEKALDNLNKALKQFNWFVDKIKKGESLLYGFPVKEICEAKNDVAHTKKG